MPWTIVVLAIVFVVGVVLWTTLDPIAEWMLDFAAAQNDSEDAQKGVASVRTFWEFWPLWFLGMLAVFGIVESIRRSTYRGGI